MSAGALEMDFFEENRFLVSVVKAGDRVTYAQTELKKHAHIHMRKQSQELTQRTHYTHKLHPLVHVHTHTDA